MEYCMTVLVSEFNTADKFAPPQPVTTVWGNALRADEVGRYIWTTGLFVQPQPINSYMFRYLPDKFRDKRWIALSLGGSDISHLKYVNDLDPVEQDRFDPYKSPISSLFKILLSGQDHWAVFILKNCDTIEYRYEQTLEDFLNTLASIYHGNSEAARGFCSYSAIS